MLGSLKGKVQSTARKVRPNCQIILIKVLYGEANEVENELEI
jgi:hypothetical protein